MRGFINKETFKTYLKSGMSIMIGGFLGNGSPDYLIDVILETDFTDFTIISNDAGYENRSVGKLFAANRVKKLVASYIGANPTVGRLMHDGSLEVVLVPQGTFVERIRAAGAGLGGILTPTGVNTIVQEGKRVINVKGIDYLLEEPIFADLALIGGAICDKYGNLVYKETMRNFNPIMATAAKKVIACCINKVDEINNEVVITPHPLVDYIVMEEKNNG